MTVVVSRSNKSIHDGEVWSMEKNGDRWIVNAWQDSSIGLIKARLHRFTLTDSELASYKTVDINTL